MDQYFIHSEMYADWGLHKLHERIAHEFDEELKLARCLVLDEKKDWRPSDLIMAKSFLD